MVLVPVEVVLECRAAVARFGEAGFVEILEPRSVGVV